MLQSPYYWKKRLYQLMYCKKAQEVNSRLINMCGERDIAFIDHADTIDAERHLNESKVHLNRSGTIEFAKNVFEFLLQQD